LFVFAVGLSATALIVAWAANPYLQPQRDTGMPREKLAELRAIAPQVDVLVIGTSRLLEGFDPRVFAAETARLGRPLRAYNFSVQRLLLWEQVRLVDEALAVPGLQPKLVLLEPAVGLGISQENFTHARTLEFETPAAWRLAVSSVLGSDRGLAHKAWNLAAHTLVAALHDVHYGLYTRLVFPDPRAVDPDREPTDPRLLGFAPQPDRPAGEPPPAWLVTMRTEYLTRFAQDSRAPGKLPATMQASFLSLQERLRRRGIAMLWVQPPQLGFTTQELRELTFGFGAAVTSPGGDPGLLTYLDPSEHPALFDPRWWLDYNHFTETGAGLFTRELAGDVTRRLGTTPP